MIRQRCTISEISEISDPLLQGLPDLFYLFANTKNRLRGGKKGKTGPAMGDH